MPNFLPVREIQALWAEQSQENQVNSDDWNASPSPTSCCVLLSHLSKPTSGKLLPPTSCSPVHPEVFSPFFFFFSCVLHPVIQQGGELMRPGFLERFVLNCPFCRLSGLAISCHISQVPVVRAGWCHKDPLAVGPWSAGIPSAGIGCVLCPRD